MGRPAAAALATASSTSPVPWPTPVDPARLLRSQGLSHCYAKNEDGKLVDQYVIEPITANSLECMANGERRAKPCLCPWGPPRPHGCKHAQHPGITTSCLTQDG